MGLQTVAENSDQAGNSEADPAIADAQTKQESLRGVLREIIHQLPGSTSLGELLAATNASPALSSVIAEMSVQELINLACERADEAPPSPAAELLEEGDLGADSGAGSTVIRRRADVPGGDRKVLAFLAKHGAASDRELAEGTELSTEQLRPLLRALENKDLVYSEGRGTKKRSRITKTGLATLPRSPRSSGSRSRSRRRSG